MTVGLLPIWDTHQLTLLWMCVPVCPNITCHPSWWFDYCVARTCPSCVSHQPVTVTGLTCDSPPTVAHVPPCPHDPMVDSPALVSVTYHCSVNSILLLVPRHWVWTLPFPCLVLIPPTCRPQPPRWDLFPVPKAGALPTGDW